MSLYNSSLFHRSKHLQPPQVEPPAPPTRPLSGLLDEFDVFLSTEKKLSELSRRAYRFDVEKFIEWANRQAGSTAPMTTHAVTDAIVKNYVLHCRDEKQYKSATLNRAIASLRVFFLFCQRHNYIKANPIARVQNPPRQKKMPIYLIDSELKKLFESPDRTDPIGRRDYAILVTLAMTGVRLRELIGLDLQHLDLESRIIKVFGKGAKERAIPLSEPSLAAIAEYLKDRPNQGRDTALFLNRFGERLSGRSVENIVKKYVEIAVIDKNHISPHKLRHSFATLLHHHNVDLLEIKTLLGHQNLSTTQIYTHTNAARLKSAVNKLDYLGNN